MKNSIGGEYMRLSELSGKEIVDLEEQKNGVLGYVDLEINEGDGQIEGYMERLIKRNHL